MALAGIELRYIVNMLSKMTAGETYYVNNVYGITRDSMLFKLHHAIKEDMFLMVSTYGIWLTSTKMSQIEENRMQRRLRSTLLRLRFSGIRQEGAERIAYITFEGFGSEYVLVVELFGDGNVILCSKQEMKVLALMRSVRVRHRTLEVGSVYVPPPAPSANTADVMDLTRQDFDELESASMVPARWIGRALGLPKKYAEGIITMAQTPRGIKGEQLESAQTDAIHDAAKKIISDVISGNHTPVIVRGAAAEALPLDMRYDDNKIENNVDGQSSENPAADDNSDSPPVVESTSSFMAGLDSVFTESLLARAKDARASGSAAKIKDLQTMIAEQKKAIDLVGARSESTTAIARALMGLVSQQGVLSISDDRVAGVLEECGGGIKREKGSFVMLLPDGGKKMPLPDMGASLQSVASMLYDEAKHQAKAAPSIQKSMDDAQRRLDRLLGTAESERVQAGEEAGTVIRKKSWFERYRWFHTSDGSLAVGGRDAASNSAVIRKQMGKDDRIFHAEVHGSPFFILKGRGNSTEPSDVTMNEVAHATVCFSRAWREGMYGMSAFWVEPDQVKKSAPTGQFMPKGSFTISGKRNFIRAQALRLAVAIVPHNGEHVVVCGPPEPVIARSVLYAIIEPQGLDLADAAKRTKSEFLKIDEDITKAHTS